MTYWAREHEHNLRRIGDAIRDLEAVREDIIIPLIHELEQDDAEATSIARHVLGQARSDVADALEALDRAKTTLPEPQRGPRFPQTAAEVMRRDG